MLVHAGAISALSSVLSGTVNYFRGPRWAASPISARCCRCCPRSRSPGDLLGTVDIFLIWYVVVLAIGLGVLYKRRTQPIAISLLSVYAVIASCIALVQEPRGRRMSRNKKILIGARRRRRPRRRSSSPTSSSSGRTASSSTSRRVQKRDLQAIVSASGKIQPQTLVNISADTMGRVTDLKVEEGQRVKKGEFLLQIDPRNLTTAYNQTQASLAAARSTMDQLRVAVDSTKTSLKQAQDDARPPAAALQGRADAERERSTTPRTRCGCASPRSARQERQIETQRMRMQQEQASVENAKLNLSKVRIESPITGIITRRNIEEGETVVIGTMNNAGTVLLTVADMSVIEAEVEVDETDIPNVTLGQKAKITIDAMPGKSFTGKVTEIGNSPIQAAGTTSASQATNFKVKVTVDDEIPDVRPGFTCTAEITTATRQQVIAIPIQATTVREMIVDKEGNIVRDETEGPQRGGRGSGAGAGAEARPGAQGARGRVRRQGQQGGVHAGQDRHRRREVLRSAVGREGRRPGDRRTVQLGARAARTAPR